MKPRDLNAAEGGHFDLAVIGAGILGINLFAEATRRGRRVLLLERADFGGEASPNSLRILHGGLRYLQSGDLGRFFESVSDRRWYCRSFPDLVEPLPCVLLLDGRGLRRRSVLAAGLAVNDLLSANRNRGIGPRNRLGSGRVLSATALRSTLPWLPSWVTGGALWYDARMTQPTRLMMEMIRGADGAVALNYVEARAVESTRGRISVLLAFDHREQTPCRFTTDLVINAAGASAGRLARRLQAGDVPELHSSLAWNVLISGGPVLPHAIVVPAPTGRFARSYVLVPCDRGTMIGTGQVIADAEQSEPSEAQLAAFLEDLRARLPVVDAGVQDVIRTYVGRIPSVGRDSADFASRPWVLDHRRIGGPSGLFSAAAVKFTTAHALARALLSRAGVEDAARETHGLPAPPPGLRTRLYLARKAQDPDHALTQGEIEALRDLGRTESALSTEDLVVRRLGVIDCPERAAELCRLLRTAGLD